MRKTSPTGERTLVQVAHELSQPLNALMAAARVLRSTTDRDLIERARLVVEDQAVYMQGLVTGVLEQARQRRSTVALHRTRLDLREIVARVYQAAETVCGERRIATTASWPSQPVWVDGDALRLQEIVWNLMANAVRYTPADGQIALSIVPCAQTVSVVVRDSGVGIEPGEADHIFEPFAQGESAAPDGFGLGLAVARELAEAHAGRLTASSPGRGHGSEFTLTLPLALAD